MARAYRLISSDGHLSHDDVYKAITRAYNDWLAEEYCAVAPDRLLGMGVIPSTCSLLKRQLL